MAGSIVTNDVVPSSFTVMRPGFPGAPSNITPWRRARVDIASPRSVAGGKLAA
jgi:hypothetical protein